MLQQATVYTTNSVELHNIIGITLSVTRSADELHQAFWAASADDVNIVHTII